MARGCRNSHNFHCVCCSSRLQRKRRKAAIKKARYEKSKAEAAEYHKLLMQVRSA
jgi:hypothetical protein